MFSLSISLVPHLFMSPQAPKPKTVPQGCDTLIGLLGSFHNQSALWYRLCCGNPIINRTTFCNLIRISHPHYNTKKKIRHMPNFLFILVYFAKPSYLSTTSPSTGSSSEADLSSDLLSEAAPSEPPASFEAS